MEPVDNDLPPDLVADGPVRRQPAGSPYAVPLGTLTAGAYVAVTDQVQLQPDDGRVVGDAGSAVPAADPD